MKRSATLKTGLLIICLLLQFNLWAQNAQPTVLHVETAGTLPSMIEESKKYEITDLTLTGYFNGTDVLFIREMSGSNRFGKKTIGKLENLDLSGANIVKGGDPYYASNYTADNQIPKYMLCGCHSLKTIILPKNITSIGTCAFANCSELTEITIPESVISIGDVAFRSCHGLKEIIVSEQNTSYSSFEGVLFNKDKTVLLLYPEAKTDIHYTIPNSVTKIEGYAFSGCEKLTTITIPNSVTKIKRYAFHCCRGLTEVTIPNSVTEIGEGAFEGCSGLSGITIPDSVKSIGKNAFSGCIKLTAITIPNSVTEIGEMAFDECNRLFEFVVSGENTSYSSSEGVLFNKDKTVLISYPKAKTDAHYTIPNSVAKIEKCAFERCFRLTEITIPNSVTEIGEGAFELCSGLTEVTIPSSVTEIGERAFDDCHKLKEIIVSEENTSYSSFEGVLFNKDKTVLILYPKAKIDIHYTIPNCVTSIENYAFSNCRRLTEVTIPESVTEIGNYAFYDCIGLAEVTIPNSVRSIGNYAFYNCSWVTEVTIPNSVTLIGDGAFESCSRLTGITIPNSVTKIGNHAFLDCSKLEEIIVSEQNTSYSSSEGVLFNKDKTVLILYPEAKTDIHYTIPNSVTSIVVRAFDDCRKLTKVTIPESVTEIEPIAFFRCQNLMKVYCKGSTPPISDLNSFPDKVKSEGILYVPKNSYAAYSTAPGWMDFKNIVEDKLQ
ncbi:leucine-rich repeat domain-containing protein [Bacteroidales bacterium OttesenSCG-928-A17]|nr:leucine-rich repeat domain-containing protein [Bacteroidales bacterium OttesenSCG-928-A17]